MKKALAIALVLAFIMTLPACGSVGQSLDDSQIFVSGGSVSDFHVSDGDVSSSDENLDLPFFVGGEFAVSSAEKNGEKVSFERQDCPVFAFHQDGAGIIMLNGYTGGISWLFTDDRLVVSEDNTNSKMDFIAEDNRLVTEQNGFKLVYTRIVIETEE